jgi:hypothetical protein
MAAAVAQLARRRGDCPSYAAALDAALAAVVAWAVVELGLVDTRNP